MIERDVGIGPAPELAGDRENAIDRGKIGPIPVILAASILLLILILLVFMPR